MTCPVSRVSPCLWRPGPASSTTTWSMVKGVGEPGPVSEETIIVCSRAHLGVINEVSGSHNRVASGAGLTGVGCLCWLTGRDKIDIHSAAEPVEDAHSRQEMMEAGHRRSIVSRALSVFPLSVRRARVEIGRLFFSSLPPRRTSRPLVFFLDCRTFCFFAHVSHGSAPSIQIQFGVDQTGGCTGGKWHPFR